MSTTTTVVKPDTTMSDRTLNYAFGLGFTSRRVQQILFKLTGSTDILAMTEAQALEVMREISLQKAEKLYAKRFFGPQKPNHAILTDAGLGGMNQRGLGRQALPARIREEENKIMEEQIKTERNTITLRQLATMLNIEYGVVVRLRRIYPLPTTPTPGHGYKGEIHLLDKAWVDNEMPNLREWVRLHTRAPKVVEAAPVVASTVEPVEINIPQSVLAPKTPTLPQRSIVPRPRLVTPEPTSVEVIEVKPLSPIIENENLPFVISVDRTGFFNNKKTSIVFIDKYGKIRHSTFPGHLDRDKGHELITA